MRKLEDMDKYDLIELMDNLSKKIDSGRHTGAEVQIFRKTTEIYIKKYEPEIAKIIFNEVKK